MKYLEVQWCAKEDEKADVHELGAIQRKIYITRGVKRRWLEGVIQDESGRVVVTPEVSQRLRDHLEELGTKLRDQAYDLEGESARREAERAAQQQVPPPAAGGRRTKWTTS